MRGPSEQRRPGKEPVGGYEAGVRGRGCNTIRSPKVTDASRRSDGYAQKTARTYPGRPARRPERGRSAARQSEREAGVSRGRNSRRKRAGGRKPRVNEETGGLTATKARTVRRPEWDAKVRGQKEARHDEGNADAAGTGKDGGKPSARRSSPASGVNSQRHL